jgi:hypothetical protein
MAIDALGCGGCGVCFKFVEAYGTAELHLGSSTSAIILRVPVRVPIGTAIQICIPYWFSRLTSTYTK